MIMMNTAFSHIIFNRNNTPGARKGRRPPRRPAGALLLFLLGGILCLIGLVDLLSASAVLLGHVQTMVVRRGDGSKEGGTIADSPDHTATTTSKSSSSTSTLLTLPPGTDTIILNIGSNIDPILPQRNLGPCAKTIAFEPIVAAQIPPHPQLLVVPAAVSGGRNAGSTDGSSTPASLATMYTYNKHAVSSSLSPASHGSAWNTGRHNRGVRLVPVLEFAAVLSAIPPNISMAFCQTDAQGYDYSIVSSAIDLLHARPVQFLKTEVWLDRAVAYQGVQNDLCHDWWPFMTAHGYELVGLFVQNKAKANVDEYRAPDEVLRETCRQGNDQNAQPPPETHAGLKEADALWRRKDDDNTRNDGTQPPETKEQIIQNQGSRFQYPVHGPNQPTLFTPQEYASCGK